MESILLGAAGLITACTIIITAISKIFNKAMEPIKKKIDDLDKNQCKNFLVEFLSDVENGIKKDEVQILLAHEIYDRYTSLGGNSYIHSKWERIMEKEER